MKCIKYTPKKLLFSSNPSNTKVRGPMVFYIGTPIYGDDRTFICPSDNMENPLKGKNIVATFDIPSYFAGGYLVLYDDGTLFRRKYGSGLPIIMEDTGTYETYGDEND